MHIKKYGRWLSPISAEQVFAGTASINFLRVSNQGLYFITNQAEATDQYQLSLLNHQNQLSAMTPPEFNLRSAVHEYGAIPYAFTDSAIYFVNFEDQRLYQQCIGEQPVALTPPSNRELRFADIIVDEKNNRLICVREDHRHSQGKSAKVKNTLVSINLETGGEGEVIYAESDFVSSPGLSSDGKYLCWQTWQHPNMPWDDTQLLIAEIDGNGELFNYQSITKNIKGSLVQAIFNQHDDLYFIADWSNWWNLYRLQKKHYQGTEQASGELSVHKILADNSEQISNSEAEYTSPQWTLGQRNYALINEQQVLLSYSKDGLWYMGVLSLDLSLDTHHLETLSGVYGEISNVVVNQEFGYFCAKKADSLVSIYKVALSSEGKNKIEKLYDPGQTQAINSGELSLLKPMISTAEAFSFPSGNEARSYGFFYPPKNQNFKAPSNELPPLLIGIHGGPTSASNSSLNLQTQFWTSRGFAVAEINHRGSTGYGRTYRQSLYGQWGVYDLEDTIAGVEYLISQGLVDGNRVAIHGGSAGGYTVMAMLAFHDLFKAGASYYGISDLEALAVDTHKFESRYLDQLIGPYPETKDLYQQRSPLNYVENISAPLLILQGQEDKVVPYGQAKEIYEKIKDKVKLCDFVSFPDEGHGFRKKKNQIYALNKELEFYTKVLGF